MTRTSGVVIEKLNQTYGLGNSQHCFDQRQLSLHQLNCFSAIEALEEAMNSGVNLEGQAATKQQGN